jgi:hypothetical protein
MLNKQATEKLNLYKKPICNLSICFVHTENVVILITEPKVFQNLVFAYKNVGSNHSFVLGIANSKSKQALIHISIKLAWNGTEKHIEPLM